MKIAQFIRKGDHVFSALCVLVLAVLMVWLMAGDIERMQAATTNYEYYSNFVYLIDNIARTYFFCIFMLMLFFTYANKQYSKWIIRLFYVLGLSSLAYFVVAGHVYDYVFHHVESDYTKNLPSLARTVFTRPIYWIIIGYFFIPKILKDAQKMKE